VPVGARDSLTALRHEADDIVCLEATPRLVTVGRSYEDFDPVPTRR